MALDVTTRERFIKETFDIVSDEQVLHTAYFSGNLTNAGVATIMALDAFGGTCKDIMVVVAYHGATAGNITPQWFVTDPLDTATFDHVDPDIRAAHALGAARTEVYTFGDLARDCQLELRVTSAGNDAALTYDAWVVYLQ